MAVVLFTSALQSFHAIGHSWTQPIASQQTIEKSAHQHADIAASDETLDDAHCSICDFHFDHFIPVYALSLRVDFDHYSIPYLFSCIAGDSYFSGALLQHRGPPATV